MSEYRAEGRAEGHGRVYQATGDMHIVEHHHGEPGWTGPDSVRQPPAGRGPATLRDRTELMARLRAAVGSADGGQVYVLHGMGGSGKTAVAQTLFRYATEECGRVGLWVNGADQAAVRAGMLAVAADRGASEGELIAARSGLRAAADLVWDRLHHSGQPWLLVLDNADDPEVLQRGGWLRASPRGTVLVTSRQAAARSWPGAERLHVGVLPRADAAQVLCDLAPETGTVEEAAEIADRLGRLPLALTLAGSFLAHQILDPWSMADYSRNLDGGDGLDLLDRGADPTGESRRLLGRTWQLSLDALSARGLAEATTLLRLLACWGSDPLPLSLLTGADLGPDLSRAQLEPALRGLLDHSLTELGQEGVRCLRTHGVVLDSVARGTPPPVLAGLTAAAARALDAAVPAVSDWGPPDAVLSLIAPHALALLRRAERPEVAASALDTTVRLAAALHRGGDYLSAYELASEAVALTTPLLGGEHPSVLDAQTRVGRALFRLGRVAEAEELHRRVLGVQERVAGPDHPSTLSSCYFLQYPLYLLGREPESRQMVRRAIDGRTRVLGPGHPLTLRARSSLLQYPGPGLAAVVDLQLPQECARYLGAEHPMTLATRLDHAFALLETGRAAEADADAGPIAAEYERRFGADFPITYAARTLYARTRAAVGDPDRAVELITGVIEARTRALGPDHPYLVLDRALLAEFRAAQAAAPDRG